MRSALFALLCIATIVLDADAILVPVIGKVHYFANDMSDGSDPLWLFHELGLKNNPTDSKIQDNNQLCAAVAEKQSTLTSSDMIIVFTNTRFCNVARSEPSVIQIQKRWMEKAEMKYQIGNLESTVTAATNKRQSLTDLLKIAFFDQIVVTLEPILSLYSYSNIFAILTSLFGGITLKHVSDENDAEVQRIRADIARMQPENIRNAHRDVYSITPLHTRAEFREWMKYIVEIIIDYKEHPEVYQVLIDREPGFIINNWNQTAPEEPDEFKDILKDIMSKVMPNMTHWQHPRFHAYFATGCSYPDILADTLISGFGNISFNWDSCPAYAEMEVIVMNWLGKVFGLPDQFLFTIPNPNKGKGGGAMQDSASDCVLVALITARDRYVKKFEGQRIQAMTENKENENPTKKTSPLEDREMLNNFTDRKEHHVELPYLVAYASKEAHSCLEKATKLTCVHLRVVDTNDNMEMTWGELKSAMEHDIEMNRIPIFVHVTTGTTATGAFDKLKDIGKGLRNYTALPHKKGLQKDFIERIMKEIWIHVDGAYGGSLWTLPTGRSDKTGYTGLVYADSVNINLHKIFLHSSSAGCIWTKNQKRLKQAMNVDPVYLKPADDRAIDFRNYGIPLTRRQRFMKAWFVLRMYGVKGMQAYISQLIKMSKHMRALLERNPYVELIGQLTYTVSCIRLNAKRNLTEEEEKQNQNGKTLARPEPIPEEERNQLTEELAAFINKTCLLAVTKAKPKGKTVVRISVSHQMSQEKEIEESHEILLQLIKRFNNGERVATLNGQPPSDPPGHETTTHQMLLPNDPGVIGTPPDTPDKTQPSVGRVTSSANIASPSGQGN
uniref:Arginine decarboxylase n=1 Tax=Panagrellus redivivus TaxID=6233 RepID=A0A7E4UVY0_PANRE